MRVVTFSEENLQTILDALSGGGVIAHATETCYGLACDLTNPEAVAKLFAIKDRPAQQAVSSLFASTEQAKEYLEWSDLAEELTSKHLPGPLTIVMPVKNDAPKKLYTTPEGTPTVGLRISSHPRAQVIAEAYGSPLSTTSANVHGEPNPYSAVDIMAQYEGRDTLPDLIIDDGELPVSDASTVVDISTGEIKVLRQGFIQFA